MKKKARDYVTRIQKADGVVKGSTEVEQKAKAETKKGDPKNAQEVIADNTQGSGEIDGNGSGIKFTTKGAREAAKTERKAEKAEVKDAKSAEKAILKAEKEHPNPNTQLDDEEKQAREDGTLGQEDAEEKAENAEKAEETTLKPGDIANPATSKEQNEKK